MHVASSGRLVPIATIVSPITRSLTPNRTAIPVAPRTIRLAPITSPAIPATIMMQ